MGTWRRLAGQCTGMAIAGSVWAIAAAPPTVAQLIEDTAPGRSLGTQVVPSVDPRIDLILNGTQRGQNLFHSFQEFNVQLGRGAYFEIPNATIQNVLARVTGGNRSEILGTLGTFRASDRAVRVPGVNLFLVNPNGIVFGANASLDVGGSFFATTANAVQLGVSGLFSASQPESSNLLAIDPSAFLFNAIANQNLPEIVVRSQASSTVLGNPTIGLQVPDGETLLLLGGNVQVENGQLAAPGGRVEVGAVAGMATVGLNPNSSLTFSKETERANAFFENGTKVYSILRNTTPANGSSIAITAQDIIVSNQSLFFAGILGGFGTLESQAGDITLDAKGLIRIDQSSEVVNIVDEGAIGNAGNINISADSLFLTDGAAIDSSTDGEGNAGNILVNVTGTAFLSRANILSGIIYGNGNGGNISIKAASLSADRVSLDSSNTGGNGNAGSISVKASGLISFTNSNLLSNMAILTEGNAGNIIVSAGSFLSKGTEIEATTQAYSGRGRGNAGNVSILVGGDAIFTAGTPETRIDFDGSSYVYIPEGIIRTGVNFGSAGKGGDIIIKANSLSLNQIRLDSSTRTGGVAGNIWFQTDGSVSLANTEINVGNFNGQYVGGVAGNLTIQAGSLSLVDKSEINAGNVGKNDQSITQGGIISLQVDGTVFISGSRILSQALFSGAPGEDNAGRIEIRADSLYLTDAAEISASTEAQAKAGSIFIQADNSVTLTNGSVISSLVERRTKGGIGGDIEIQTQTLNLVNGGLLNASILGDFQFQTTRGTTLTTSGGSGVGGSIRVTATDSVNISGVSSTSETLRSLSDGALSPPGTSSGIYSRTERGASGPGGEISINAGTFRLSEGGVVSAQTFNAGSGGNITINARNFEAFSGGQVLTTAFSSGKSGNVAVDVLTGATISGSDPDFSSRVQQFNRDVVANVSPSSGVFANTEANSIADGGNISLKTGNFQLIDGGQLSAQSLGTGSAGNITIRASGTFKANNGNVTTTAQFTGGAIDITAKIIRLKDSDITTNVSNGGGGNITLASNSIIALGDSDILAFAQQGRGGNITFNTPAFFGQNYRPDSPSPFDGNNRVDINASGTVSGIITIPDTTFIQNGLTQLSQNLTDPNTLLANSCIVRNRKQNGSFFITGSGGLPVRPGDAPPASFPTGEVRSLPNTQSQSDRPWKPGDAIVEPQGIYRLPNGSLVMSRECEQ